MRSFQQIVAVLFAFLMCAFAQSVSQSSGAYEATVYITSTVYRVNTVTLSGSHTGTVANQTSTVPAVYPTVASTGAYSSYKAGNGTSVAPSGTQAKPSASQFTGAASTLNANAFVAALAAGVGYLVL